MVEINVLQYVCGIRLQFIRSQPTTPNKTLKCNVGGSGFTLAVGRIISGWEYMKGLPQLRDSPLDIVID